MRIPTAAVDRYVYFVAVDSTDLKTRETGLTTFTVYYSLQGAAAVAMTTPTVNETDQTNMPGVYELLIDESGMTTLTAGHDTEELVLHITQASMAPVTRAIEIHRPEVTQGNTLDVTAGGEAGLDLNNTTGTIDAAEIATGAITAAKFAAGAIDAAAIANGAIDAATFAASAIDATAIATGAITAAKFAAGAIDAAAIAASAIGSSELAAGAITTATFAAGAIDAAAIAANAIGASELAADAATEIGNAVWDTDATARQTAGTFGQAIGDPGADTTTIYKAVVTDAAGATVGDDVVNVWLAIIAIAAQTDDIGVAGAGLTAVPWNAAWDAEVESEVDDSLGGGTGTALTAIPWNATWDAEVQSEAADALNAYDPPTRAELTTDIDSLPTAAEVNAEVVDALTTDTYGEPSQAAPGATVSLEDKISYLYNALIGRVDVTATLKEFHNDALTVIWKKALSDDGTTYTEGEGATGP